MLVPTAADLNGLDAARIGSVLGALGQQRFSEFLGILGARLQDFAEAVEISTGDLKVLIPALHQSRGSAGSLGLVGLASAMSEIEVLITAVTLDATCRHIGDEAKVTAVKSAARALVGRWHTAVLNLSLQYDGVCSDHASGSCSR